ncbi:hypothetical protein [Paenisporosarcina indica]|uniref:hypothetical protein n=1 Tax=Paenisporosarcina indica TaxID=650093 RepID=UPI00094F4A44|nr:hypothetical protein [Paenisporosarcina indica]
MPELKDMYRGYTFVAIGFIFLIITVMQTSVSILWGILIGISIFSNIIGIVILINFIRPKLSEE